MSARLKLKELKKEMELAETRCRMREYEAKLAQCKCNRLLKKNIQQIGVSLELCLLDMDRGATEYLKFAAHKAAAAIVYK